MDPVPERPTGQQLYGEVQRYRSRVRCSQAEFSRCSGITEQTLRSIELADQPLDRTVRRVRDFIAAHPERCAAGGAREGGWLAPSTPRPRGPALVTQRDGAKSLEAARALSIAPARPSIAAIVAAEAEDAARRRRDAREGSPVHPVAIAPRDAAPAETIATALVETPGDLIARVRAAWPELWAGVLHAARLRGETPGATLMTVISRGLEEFSA